jgi:hypothetical protein
VNGWGGSSTAYRQWLDDFGFTGPPYPQIPVVSVNGQLNVAPNSNCAWNAIGYGGLPPYTFEWYKDGNYVASGPTYQTNVGTSSFELLVKIWDAAPSSAETMVAVNVQNGYAFCPE